MKNSSQLLLVDGMALLFRAFYATSVTGQFMINTKGIPTNAVQGFMRHFLTALEEMEPSHAIVCWDMGSKTFRSEKFDGYKANREAPPIELIPQFDLVKEVVAAFDVPNVGVIGYEADDCIGTIAKSVQNDIKVSILTGDKDLLQLVDHQIDVNIIQKGFGNYKTFSNEIFYEEYGITPRQFIDVKALMGDTSDGYPGVKGIGEKTALKLIQQFETIPVLLENLHQLTPSQRKKIEEDLAMLHMSRELAEIKCDVPLTFSLEEAELNTISPQFLSFIDDLELRSIRRHLIQSKWSNLAKQA
ncbi:5'-3' exonuclease H3TH domain-containing protein [Bacillus sp. FJAT-49736]|uniref:5'-3' exonuclease n=1 Tax=Bacillus sp. FJAT-49736 TaxID=2833582 RepID=UPI001BC925DB|nr:5'-3' exonuclease H3TH domain-containing protein [Bacillus sp. FJAT-49736]MBS4173217.1 5'-3' exonuclease [Bacillus sp. FJAT-49736]